MSDLVRWLDARTSLTRSLSSSDQASAAADQLEGVGRRDERNRETTVMSALNLLRAYRYPQLAATAEGSLTPERFLDGEANTIYVVAAGHDQEVLRPVILALLAATYETAVIRARRHGPLEPRLFMLMDEAANIAPVRNLASWLSQCGDHGIVIATIWQSIAQIDQRYGRPATRRDLRRLYRPGSSSAAGGADERRVSHRAARRGARRERVHRTLAPHSRRQPSEGWTRAVAQTDRTRTRDPDLPRPAARDRSGTRMVRGPPVRALCEAARGPRTLGTLLIGAKRPAEQQSLGTFENSLAVAFVSRPEHHVSNSVTAPAQAKQRSRTPGARRAVGRLAVGDYVGQPAAEAAQAVRRAGLRPGLDRSFGCDHDLVGLVVEQDPAGGEELARNGMVTLYVAAPGPATAAEHTDADIYDAAQGTISLVAEDAALQSPDARPSPSGAPPPRKPGRTGGATARTSDPAAPAHSADTAHIRTGDAR